MSKEYIPDMSDFQCIGYMIADAATKTASEKAGSPLYLDAYLAAVQDNLGVTESEHSKVACELAGREVMADFVTRMMLNK